MVCAVCGCDKCEYQMFSAGLEYWCPQCADTHAFGDAEVPPRIALLRTHEGRLELIQEIMEKREHGAEG